MFYFKEKQKSDQNKPNSIDSGYISLNNLKKQMIILSNSDLFSFYKHYL